MLRLERTLRILDFDIENRPLSYWIPEQPTSEITAIAACWTDNISSLDSRLLGETEPEEILSWFVDLYNRADIVTGHYIRRHDLPTINGALMEYGMEPLKPKLTIDTRLDMIKKVGIPATQEYLCDIFNIPVEKYHMTQKKWREANRLTYAGYAETHKRVTTDVLQHMMLRTEMVKRGLLKPPKVWAP